MNNYQDGISMIESDIIYRLAFEQAELAILVLNNRSIPIIWNKAFMELFAEIAGFTPLEFAFPVFDWLEEQNSSRYSYYANEIMNGRMQQASFESGIRTHKNCRLWLKTSLRSLLGNGYAKNTANAKQDLQNEAYLFCTFQNISEQKNRELDLVSAKEEAEKATQTKSQFLANMSHEIRTPIQTILGMTELLEETALDREQDDYTKNVRFAAEVLLSLINDILDFSKIEAGKLELENTDFELKAVLRQAINLMILDAHKKGLEVILDIDEELPQYVSGDAGRLRQVIVNLFKNAVRYTDYGEVVIEAKLEKESGIEGSFGQLYVTVSDSGPGIPETLKDKLFAPFVQGNSHIKAQGGTGLGLAISRNLLSAMGGVISLKPNITRGSVFCFTLPIKRPLDTGLAIAAPKKRALSPSRVLVVDDHPKALACSVKLLNSFGLRADGAATGEEALSLLRSAAKQEKPYSVCLIDQNMPGMDGWRLAAEINADKLINGTKLILLAPEGGMGPDAKMKLLQWFNAYATKPLNPAQLYAIMSKAILDDIELAPIEESLMEKAVASAGTHDSLARKAEAVKLAAKSLKLLLAEDHPVNQELFIAILKRLGHEVVLAHNGLEAVEQAAKNNFDLVLMDVFMPEMNGYEATKALRKKGFNIPIIAVTASALKGERDKCIEVGMNDVLLKPFKKNDLKSMLDRWAERSFALKKDVAKAGTKLHEPGTVDFSALLDSFLGQRDRVNGLLSRFIEKTKSQLANMDAAVQAKDAKTVRELAHSIKGAAWTLAAKALGDCAMKIEAAAAAGDSAAAGLLLPDLESIFGSFELEAVKFIESADKSCAG